MMSPEQETLKQSEQKTNCSDCGAAAAVPLPAVVCCSDDQQGSNVTNRGSSSSSSKLRSLAAEAQRHSVSCTTGGMQLFWWK